MIRSMTGFGAADGTVGGARVSVELRTVNHRFFSPSIKLPSEFARWENDVREALRQRVTRGPVTASARVERTERDTGVRIDESKFAAYVEQLRALQRRHGMGDGLDVGTVLRMPDVLGQRAEEEATGTAQELVAIVIAAAEALAAMRESEGGRLAAYLRERLTIVESCLGRIAARAPERLTEQRERLRTAVRELSEGVQVDDQRLAQEIAILADRLDVQEELSRFRSHIHAFVQTLEQGASDGVGKRLGFLLQEMVREANTTGSKANDAAIQREVVTVKEELERMREQVENLE